MEKRDATEDLTVKIVAVDELTDAERMKLVPVFRVRGTQRSLMGYAERSERLRGANEIRIIGDGETEIVYSKSDA